MVLDAAREGHGSPQPLHPHIFLPPLSEVEGGTGLPEEDLARAHSVWCPVKWSGAAEKPCGGAGAKREEGRWEEALWSP